MPKNSTSSDQLIQAVRRCRQNVMDLIEIHHGDQPGWDLLRSRLLKAFGTGSQGLERAVQDIVQHEQFNQNWEA